MVISQQSLVQETSFSENTNEDGDLIEDENEEDENQRIYLHIYDYETDAFSSVTTYHGLVRIYNAHNWPSRIFWIITVLCWLTMFMVHSGTLLWSYNQHETEVLVQVVVPENGVQFPAVTVCNLNPVVPSKIAAWNMSDNVINYLLKSHREVGKLPTSAVTGRYLATEHEEYLRYTEDYKSRTGRDFDIGTFFHETGNTCEDMVLSCRWSRKIIPNCCNYSVPVITDLGKCMTFSKLNGLEEQQRQKISGASYGFHILLDINLSNRRSGSKEKYKDAGIRIFIHPENALPYLHTSGFAAQPGTKVYGSVMLRKVQLLSTDEGGSCLEKWDEDVHGKRLVNKNYSAAHCEANCVANVYWSKCNCVPLSKQFNTKMRVCTPYELHNCTKDDHIPLKREISEEVYSTCGCSIECNRHLYSTSAHYAAITKSHRHIHTRYGVTRDYVRENYIAADVFMEHIVYEEHTQTAQSKRVEVLSSIGGSLSFFLGMSTITLWEIFIYLFKSIWSAMSTDRRKRFAKKEKKIMDKQMDDLEKRILPPDDISVIVESGNDDDQFQERQPSRLLSRRASEMPRTSRRTSEAITDANRPRTASDQDKRNQDNDIYLHRPCSSKQSAAEDVQFAIDNHGTNITSPAPLIDLGNARSRERVDLAEMERRAATVMRIRSNEDNDGNRMRRPSNIVIRRVSMAVGRPNTPRRASLRKMVLKQGRARHLSEHETASSTAANKLGSELRRPSASVMLRRSSTVPTARRTSDQEATGSNEQITSGRKESIQSTESTSGDVLVTIVDHRRPSVATWTRDEQIHHLRRPLRPLLRKPARAMVVERRPSHAMPSILLRSTGGAADDERRDSNVSQLPQLRRSSSVTVDRRPSKTPSATGSTTSSQRASNKDIHLTVVSDTRRLSAVPATNYPMFRRPSRGQLLLRRPSRTIVIEQRRPSLRPATPPIGEDGSPVLQSRVDRRPSNIHPSLLNDRRRPSLTPVVRVPSRLAAEPKPSSSAQSDSASDPLGKDEAA